MYIFVRTRSDPIELVQVGLLDLVQYSFVVVAVIALAGRIDLFLDRKSVVWGTRGDVVGRRDII